MNSNDSGISGSCYRLMRGWGMNNKSLLDDILDLSEQIGILRGQRMCYGYSPQDAIIEHGLRSALHEKKQRLMEMLTP